MSQRFAACNLCDCLCGLALEVDEVAQRVTKLRGDPDDPFSRGHVCPKAVGLRDLLEDPDRVRSPKIRNADGSFRDASWEEALDAAAEPLRRIRREHGADAVALYTGNPIVHSHRGLLAAGLLRAIFGTKNQFDPNSQDANPRLFACQQVYGDSLFHPIPDVERTKFLLILGANPAASNGGQVALGDPKARFAEMRARGARVVLLDPRRTETADWCTEYHPIRPGGDAALLLSMLRVIFADGLYDAPILVGISRGIEDLRAAASREDFEPERVGPRIGVPAATIVALAWDFARADGAVAYSRVGVCQSEFGPTSSWLVEALNVVTGNVDRVGGALLPRPAADIAPIARLAVGTRYGRWRSRVRGLPEFLGVLPTAAMTEEMETPGRGQVRALVLLAGNPVLSTPGGGERLARALAGLEQFVSLDFYLNESNRFAHVVLPPRHVFETGSYDLALARYAIHHVARWSEPVLRTNDDTRDDWEIATELGLRVRVPRALHGIVRRLMRRAPERVVDLLLRVGPRRLSLAKLRAAPHGLDLGPLEPIGRVSRFRDGRARLAPPALLADVDRVAAWLKEPPSDLVLIGRRHVRSNNSWLHNLPAMVKGPGRAQLLLHPDDAARRGVADGARVTVKSRAGAVEVEASVTDAMMPGIVSLPHGFGHGAAKETLRVAGALGGPNVNVLTDVERIEPVIAQSILNGVPVELEAAAPASHRAPPSPLR